MPIRSIVVQVVVNGFMQFRSSLRIQPLVCLGFAIIPINMLKQDPNIFGFDFFYLKPLAKQKMVSFRSINFSLSRVVQQLISTALDRNRAIDFLLIILLNIIIESINQVHCKTLKLINFLEGKRLKGFSCFCIFILHFTTKSLFSV